MIKHIQLVQMLLGLPDPLQVELVSIVDDQDNRCCHSNGEEGSFFKVNKNDRCC